MGLLANLPDAIKADFEVSSFSITREYQAVAAAKGEERLINEINNTLLRLEKKVKQTRSTIVGLALKQNRLNLVVILNLPRYQSKHHNLDL